MKLLDKYILKELLVPFLAGIAAFTFILAGSTVLFPLIGEAAKYSIPVIAIIQLFILKLPALIALSFPMSVLLATLLVFGRMGNDLEIISLRASGLSIIRLIIPVIFFGLSVSVLSVFFTEAVVPSASYKAGKLFRSYRYSETPTVKENINLTEYTNGLPSRIINVAEIDNGILKNITIAEYEDGQLIRLIRSNTGKWLPSGGWEFYNGVMHYYNKKDPKRVTVLEFKTEFINIKINPLDSKLEKKNAEEMTRKDLKERIDLDIRTGQDPIKNLMDYHMKLSIAFASLIYSILGASIGLRPHRSSSAMGLGVSLFIIFIYFILISVGMALGLAHLVPSLIAAWFPNIITGIAGLILLNKVAAQ